MVNLRTFISVLPQGGGRLARRGGVNRAARMVPTKSIALCVTLTVVGLSADRLHVPALISFSRHRLADLPIGKPHPSNEPYQP